jgi:hypothetical protein
MDDDDFRNMKTLFPPFSEHPTFLLCEADIDGVFNNVPRMLNVGCEGHDVHIDPRRLVPYFATHLSVAESLEGTSTRAAFERELESIQVACFDALSKLEDAMVNRLEELEAKFAKAASSQVEVMERSALYQEQLEAKLSALESTNSSLMSRCALLQCQLDALRAELSQA